MISERARLRFLPIAIIVCVQALALIACAQGEGEGEAGSRDWHGAYRWGHEVTSFCPCGTGRCYWVRAEPEVRRQLRAYVEHHTQAPYQPVYLRLRGAVLDLPRQGFALDYDGLIRVDRILSLQSVLPMSCD